MTASAYLPNTGDLIWTDFDPTKGREQAGRRPALVISPAAFTENTGQAIVCPITSRVRPFPTSVVLPSSLPITGEILTSRIRGIDTQARPIRHAGIALSDEIARRSGRSSTSSSQFESARLSEKFGRCRGITAVTQKSITFFCRLNRSRGVGRQ